MEVCLNIIYIILFLITFTITIIKLYIELTKKRVTCNTCMIGKTVLITGGNSGLGFQTAVMLAGRGARVIVADCNDSTESKSKIIQQTGNHNVVTKKVNLLSLDSIRKFAKEINNEEERLDVLINNAGTGFTPGRTEDGLAAHMQVNILGAFLLTHLLIDLLKKSSPSRIIFVSSLLAYLNNVTADNLNEVVSNPFVSYGNTKFCNAVISNVFARKLQGTGVTSNALQPGAVSTQILNSVPVPAECETIFRICAFFINLMGTSAYEGAQCHVHCALSKELTQISGKFFANCAPSFHPFGTTNVEFGEKVWKKCEELVKLKVEEKL